ncbi:LOB domain-containing protein 18 [Cajanus cajan]|uniref:LOB domain-containing protein 18 n=1 Tax=Cajanus cajan TaxID=3821 RepID=A0A151TB81_CAJCA|nr:LOB domain-containing protein 18 [Cajanus cajan]KYP64286.1 LOB domain-containing protein 18 [Cajanus cajan]
MNSGSGGNNNGGGGSGGGHTGSPCGACKFLRRKCVSSCIFAPYFDSEQGTAHFAAVHKVFGASNVSKLLLNIPTNRRLDAVITICYEAQSRLRDPVYGCVAHIFALQQQVANLQAELSYLHGHLTHIEVPHPSPPPTPQPTAPPLFSIADLPATATAPAIPVTYDLSSLFEPMGQSSWAMQQRGMDPRHYMGGGAPSTTITQSPPTAPSSSNSSPLPSLSLSK